jgi:hypothetical protein
LPSETAADILVWLVRVVIDFMLIPVKVMWKIFLPRSEHGHSFKCYWFDRPRYLLHNGRLASAFRSQHTRLMGSRHGDPKSETNCNMD